MKDINIEYLIHELKSPVSVAETALTALLKKEKFGGVNDKQEKILKRALKNTKKIREMIYSLLESSKAECFVFNYTNFNPCDVLYEVLLDALETSDLDLLDDILELKEKDKIIKFLSKNGIIFNIDFKDISLYQDETKFRYIVGNVIQNALKYKMSCVEIFMRSENDSICIEVEDDGPGIAVKYHKIIFEPYKQSVEKISDIKRLKPVGHGLGLSGALIMSESLGGTIKVKSDKGRGALFQIILPVNFNRKGDDK